MPHSARSIHILVCIVCCLFVWSGGMLYFSKAWSASQPTFSTLQPHDVPIRTLFTQWEWIREMLRKGPQGAVYTQLWKKMEKWDVRAQIEHFRGLITPSWLIDARSGQLILNQVELHSLRYQFNVQVQKRVRSIVADPALYVTEAWLGVPEAMIQQWFSKPKLKLIFALKLYPAVSYGLQRAVLQAKMSKQVGLSVSMELFEEVLLALAHQETIVRGLFAHPDTRQLWKLVPWRNIDRSMLHLLGSTHPKKRPRVIRLIHRTLQILHRKVCSFCPVYSSVPLVDEIDIQLKKGTKRFLLNRQRYCSLFFHRPAYLHSLFQNDLLNTIRYIQTFDRLIRLQGQHGARMRTMHERNLLLRQARRHSLWVRTFLHYIQKPHLRKKLQTFYAKQIKKELRLSVRDLAAIIRFIEHSSLWEIRSFLQWFP